MKSVSSDLRHLPLNYLPGSVLNHWRDLSDSHQVCFSLLASHSLNYKFWMSAVQGV